MRISTSLRLLKLALTVAVLAGPITSAFADQLLPPIKVDSNPLTRTPDNSFAPVVEKVTPSVVMISTSASARSVQNEMRNRNPLFNDPNWRRFFGIPDEDEDATPQTPPPRNRDGLKKRPGRQQPLGIGSGVIVSPDGHIITNNHVIEGADDIIVTLPNNRKEYKATKIGTDPDTDIAVLKIEGKNLPAITFADSDNVKVGDVVLAIGSPFALAQSVTSGIVSALGRSIMQELNGPRDWTLENFIQTDASINPGNSGGALVDAQGRLIGINTAIFSRSGGNQGIGFAVPSNLARSTMESLLTKGKVLRGFLGVKMGPLDEDLASKFNVDPTTGVLVNGVNAGTPAEKAGIKTGDVILEVNGKKIDGSHQLQLMIAGMSPGSKIDMKVIRNGESKNIQAELGERPSGGLAAAKPSVDDGAPDVLDKVTVSDIDDALRKQYEIPAGDKGVVITEIDPDSDCYAAGLRKGDVIHEIEKQDVTSSKQAVEMSEKVRKEKKVLLRVSTKGDSRYVVVRSVE